MCLAALGLAVLGAALATASLVVTEDYLIYRYGVSKRLPVSEVASVSVAVGSGAGYRRLALQVHRPTGPPLRLTALQRPNTLASRTVLDGQAASINRTLAGKR